MIIDRGYIPRVSSRTNDFSTEPTPHLSLDDRGNPGCCTLDLDKKLSSLHTENTIDLCETSREVYYC
jgi:hypothetical protein